QLGEAAAGDCAILVKGEGTNSDAVLFKYGVDLRLTPHVQLGGVVGVNDEAGAHGRCAPRNTAPAVAHLKQADSVERARFAVVEPEALSILASMSATSRNVIASTGARACWGCSRSAGSRCWVIDSPRAA